MRCEGLVPCALVSQYRIMPATAERRALAFLSAIVLLGAVARAVRAREARPVASEAAVRALDAQIARVDSARRAPRGATRLPGTTAKSAPSSRGGAPARSGASVDLDVADAATIERLPWVGPALAARIVEDRARCGPFGSLAALTRVNGIGEGTTRRLAPYVTFSGGSRPMGAAAGSGCQDAARGAAPRRRGRSGADR